MDYDDKLIRVALNHHLFANTKIITYSNKLVRKEIDSILQVENQKTLVLGSSEAINWYKDTTLYEKYIDHVEAKSVNEYFERDISVCITGGGIKK